MSNTNLTQQKGVVMPQFNTSVIDQITSHATDIALGMNHSQTTTVHVLLAIIHLASSSNDETVINLLISHGISLNNVMAALKSPVYSSEHPGLTNQISAVSQNACMLAKENVIKPIHVLIGMTAISNSQMFRLLNELKVNINVFQTNLLRAAGIEIKPIRHRPASTHIRLDEAQSATTQIETIEPQTQGLEPLALGHESVLNDCATDLSLLASQDKLGPIIGREQEIDRIMQILCKRSKNNPVLIGDAGVGKTAVAEGVAIRLASSTNVPERLKGKRMFSLNVNGLVAGTSLRGQFEERLKRLLKDLQDHPEIIIFIDELHTIMGAGSAEGSLDAAQILKPALARGTIGCIGATTIDEYRIYIEKDAALERRFQPVKILPPNEKATLIILRGLKNVLEKHHDIIYSPEAIEAAVNMSVRYIHDRNLPDKAIDLLDEAGSRKSIGLNTSKSDVVTVDDIAMVVKDWTGIPIISSDEERERMLHLAENLGRSVIGQPVAIDCLSRALLSLRDPSRPIGSFIFLGPTGVGKTELAKQLSFQLFGSTNALLRFDMSEYKEKHTISRLIGSPPGYVGYDEGGQLTEKVRRQPFSVILFDEIEKAHPDIFDVLLQVLDDGILTDGKGIQVNFCNTIIIMTSNVRVAKTKSFGFTADGNDSAKLDEQLDEALLKNGFRLEFLNRLDAKVPFNHLDKKSITAILELKLNGAEELAAEHKVTIRFSKAVKDFLVEKGFDSTYGARNLDRTIKQYILSPLGIAITKGDFQEDDTVSISLHQGKVTFTKKK